MFVALCSVYFSAPLCVCIRDHGFVELEFASPTLRPLVFTQCEISKALSPEVGQRPGPGPPSLGIWAPARCCGKSRAGKAGACRAGRRRTSRRGSGPAGCTPPSAGHSVSLQPLLGTESPGSRPGPSSSLFRLSRSIFSISSPKDAPRTLSNPLSVPPSSSPSHFPRAPCACPFLLHPSTFLFGFPDRLAGVQDRVWTFAARSAVLKPGLGTEGTPGAPPPPSNAWLVCFPRCSFGGLSLRSPVTWPTRVRLLELSATESSAPGENSETRVVSSPIEGDAPFTTLIPCTPVSLCPFSSTCRPSLSLLFDLSFTRRGLQIGPHSRPRVSEASSGFLVSRPWTLGKNNDWTGEHRPRPGTQFSPRASSSWLRLSFCSSRCPSPTLGSETHNAAGSRSFPRAPSNAGCSRPPTSVAESARGDCFHLSKDGDGGLPAQLESKKQNRERSGSDPSGGEQILSLRLISGSFL